MRRLVPLNKNKEMKIDYSIPDTRTHTSESDPKRTTLRKFSLAVGVHESNNVFPAVKRVVSGRLPAAAINWFTQHRLRWSPWENDGWTVGTREHLDKEQRKRDEFFFSYYLFYLEECKCNGHVVNHSSMGAGTGRSWIVGFALRLQAFYLSFLFWLLFFSRVIFACCELATFTVA